MKWVYLNMLVSVKKKIVWAEKFHRWAQLANNLAFDKR